MNWRLFLPASWDEETIEDSETAAAVRRRRARCKIGDDLRHREKWRLALDTLDEAGTAWALSDRPVVADSGYGDVTAFRLGLGQRGLTYVVAVKPTTGVQPGDAVVDTPP